MGSFRKQIVVYRLNGFSLLDCELIVCYLFYDLCIHLFTVNKRYLQTRDCILSTDFKERGASRFDCTYLHVCYHLTLPIVNRF